MKEGIILILAFIVVIIFGYFLMSKLGSFLKKKHQSIQNEEKIKQPSCVMLKDDLTDDEIMDEIKSFREKNDKICVLVYDSNHTHYEKMFNPYNINEI